MWRVEWSLVTEPEEGEENNMFLYRNGDKIPELSHYAVHVGTGGWSAVTGRNISIQFHMWNSTYWWNFCNLPFLGGRSVLLHLDVGDEVSLVTERCDGGVYGVLLCISLIHPGI